MFFNYGVWAVLFSLVAYYYRGWHRDTGAVWRGQVTLRLPAVHIIPVNLTPNFIYTELKLG